MKWKSRNVWHAVALWFCLLFFSLLAVHHIRGNLVRGLCAYICPYYKAKQTERQKDKKPLAFGASYDTWRRDGLLGHFYA